MMRRPDAFHHLSFSSFGLLTRCGICHEQTADVDDGIKPAVQPTICGLAARNSETITATMEIRRASDEKAAFYPFFSCVWTGSQGG